MRTETLPCTDKCPYFYAQTKTYPCAFGILWRGELRPKCDSMAGIIITKLEEELGTPIAVSASEKTANFWSGHTVVATVANGQIVYHTET